MSIQKLANYIGGDFVAPLTTDYIESFNPATGKVDHLLPDSGAEDISRAVQHAKVAFPYWSKTGVAERAKVLYRIADLIDKNQVALSEAESRDQGKPVKLALEMDIARVAHNFRFFATALLQHEESANRMDAGALNYTSRQPIGIAGLISPWNLPLYLLSWKIAPAIAAGCTVVCKPSEFTSLTAWMLGNILNDAGVPEGVVNIVFGRGAVAGQALVEHPHVPAISFTGGTVTGQKLAETAASRLKRLSLELGGKNPNLVFADCNLDEAIKMSVRASFLNQGEICLCGSRIYVEDKIYPQFVEKFVAEVKALKVGDPKASDTFMGPLVSKQHQEKVLSFIEHAKDEGAKFQLGLEQPKMQGEMANGYFVHPVIVTDVSNDSKVCQEEIFGPFVSISPFSSEDDAIQMANDSRYGLSATVWTKDVSRVHRVAEQLHAGTVWVNTWMLRDLRVPFGGMKSSGLGREGGTHSLDFFSDVKNVCIKF